MTLSLRPYQVNGLALVREAFARVRNVVLVMMVGGGKTVCAASLIRDAFHAGEKVLVLVHRRELIDQMVGKLLEAGLTPREVGVILAGDRRAMPQAPVQVASIDTLRHRVKPPADLIVLDECHRSVTKAWTDILSHYPNARRLGLTATPLRLDGKSLAPVYDELVPIALPSTLLAEGFIVAPRIFGTALAPDLSKIKTKGTDYDQTQLAEACSDAKVVGDIFEHWDKHARGLVTIAFCVNVDHSKKVRDMFLSKGVHAVHVDAETPTEDRDRILGDLRMGRIQVLCNVAICTEGFDAPIVKCLVMARPTQSTTLFIQQSGRCMRPYGGLTPIILDHARNVEAHGFPQEDRDYDLEPPKKRRPGMAPVRTCPECFAVLPVQARVCFCGYEFVVATGVTVDPNAHLVELQPKSRHETYLELLAKGRGTSWANAQFKKRYGRAPLAEWMPMEAGEPTERQAFYRDAWLQGRAKGWKEGAAGARFKVRYGMWPTQSDKAFARIEHDPDMQLGHDTPFADWVEQEVMK